MDKTNESIVKYGISGTILKAVGNSTIFIDGGHKAHHQFIHTVLLSDLKPESHYVYTCGNDMGWSDQFWFETPPKDENNWAPHLAIFGDMGNENQLWKKIN